jgi:glycosyltransferase involved in cell wall biosynthesis
MPSPSAGLTIAVDARELVGKPTGVGRYLSNLLDQWARQSEASLHRFVLYSPGPLGDGARPTPRGGATFEVRQIPGTAGTRWEQTRLPATLRRDRPDVLFAPGYSSPLFLRIPIVLMIHDVSFFARPEWFPPRARLRRQITTRLSARRARLVLTNTEFSRREIVRFLKVPEDRLRAITFGISPPTLPSALTVARQPIVLFVGSFFNRRRLPDLIRVFGRVASARPDARLEIVGDDRTYPHQDLQETAREAGVAERMTIRSYVPDATLASLYASASVFAFLSEYEGFGFTPLEALACGVPLVVLDTPVAHEVYGASARYVVAGDIDAAAAAILDLMEDGPARAAQLAGAPATLARYSWDAAARATLAAIEEAVAD